MTRRTGRTGTAGLAWTTRRARAAALAWTTRLAGASGLTGAAGLTGTAILAGPNRLAPRTRLAVLSWPARRKRAPGRPPAAVLPRSDPSWSALPPDLSHLVT
ncbi:MAG TPA: hypothetical protein VF843_01080, partial [Streptosporangiaceae bacterium]